MYKLAFSDDTVHYYTILRMNYLEECVSYFRASGECFNTITYNAIQAVIVV